MTAIERKMKMRFMDGAETQPVRAVLLFPARRTVCLNFAGQQAGSDPRGVWRNCPPPRGSRPFDPKLAGPRPPDWLRNCFRSAVRQK